MKVKNRTIYMLAAILVLIVGTYLLDEWYRFSRNTALLRAEHSALVDRFYKGIGKRSNAVLKSEAYLMTSNADILSALKNRDRERLFSIMSPYLSSLQSLFPQSPITINFLLPDGTFFLRMHNPKKFGDNNLDARPILKSVFHTKKPAFGLETCSSTISHRFVQPLAANGEFYGVLELGIDLSFIANRVSSISDMRNIIILNQKAGQLLKCSPDGIYNPEYFNNTSIPINKIMEKGTWDITRKDIAYNGVRYEVIKEFSLIDFSGIDVGKIVFVAKTSGLEEWFNSHIIRAAVMCLIGVMLIIYVARHGFIESIAELEKEHDDAIRSLKDVNTGLEERIRKEVDNCRIKDQIINQQQKVADMGLMLSALAHHWRQPINAVGLYVQDLSEAFKSGELSAEYIEEFEKNNMNLLNKLSDSIDRYRTFFEPSVSKTRFEIVKVLSEIGDMLNASLSSAGVKLTVKCKCSKRELACSVLEKMPECEYKGTEINGFLNEFKQTLLNIIYNSIDAITERYALEEHPVRNGLITISLNVDSDTISMEITDNGIGIDENIIDKIFNPFFTTKEQGKGTGIGLYMAKTVIEKYMCGTITAKNTGSGTTIEIILSREANCS